jgi:fatty acid-binding protein DegV
MSPAVLDRPPLQELDMQTASVTDEGYDALDVATNVAVEYVRKYQASEPAKVIALRSRSAPPLVAKTLLLVDSACELPQAWLDYHHVGVMPRVLRLKAGDVTETRDRDRSMLFVRELQQGNHTFAQSLPLTPVQMRDQMQRYMSPATDSVLQLSASASRSKFFVNALSATQSLVLIHNKVRRSVGNKTPLTAWVVDSLNALSGVGVMVAHAVMLREKGSPASEIAVTMNAFRRNVHTLIAPHDLAFIARTARTIEQASISGWKINLANLFDMKPLLYLNADHGQSIGRIRGHLPAMEQVLNVAGGQLRRGLATPFICLSYAGSLDDIEVLPTYKALRVLCSRHQVSLSLSMMSMSGALMLGPRALSVSFASQYFRA